MTGREIDVGPESWRRVFYARSRLDAIAKEAESYRQRHADAALRREDNRNDPTDPYVRIKYFFDIADSIPDHWSFALGDVLHNLQSALDNLIWSLAVQESGPTPPHEGRIAFPAFLKPEDFDRVTAVSLKALNSRVLAVVKRLQPFEDATAPARLNPLYLLHHLDRLDKHRSVHVIRHQQYAFDVDVAPTPEELHVRRHPAAALEYGTPIATVTFLRNRHPVEMDVKPVFTYYEAIEETSKTPLLPLGAFMETLMLSVGECFFHLTPLLASTAKG